MKLSEQFNLVCQKLFRCSKLLEDFLSRPLKYEYQAGFDYDPISNYYDFISHLLNVVSDRPIYVIYIDLTNVLVQKYISFQREQLLSTQKLSEFRRNHARLHGCEVEGSYVLLGDSGSWLIFYDAQFDLGYLFSNESKVMGAMVDFLIPS